MRSRPGLGRHPIGSCCRLPAPLVVVVVLLVAMVGTSLGLFPVLRVVVMGPSVVPVVGVVVVVLVVVFVVVAAVAVVVVVAAVAAVSSVASAVVALPLALAVVVHRWFVVLALAWVLALALDVDRVDANMPGAFLRTPARGRLCRTRTGSTCSRSPGFAAVVAAALVESHSARGR